MTGPPPYSARQIVLDDTFETSARDIEPDVERFDEIQRGVEWAIATDPERFHAVTNKRGLDLRVVLTDPPRLRWYFTIDGSESCTLRWVEPQDLPEAEEDYPSGGWPWSPDTGLEEPYPYK